MPRVRSSVKRVSRGPRKPKVVSLPNVAAVPAPQRLPQNRVISLDVTDSSEDEYSYNSPVNSKEDNPYVDLREVANPPRKKKGIMSDSESSDDDCDAVCLLMSPNTKAEPEKLSDFNVFGSLNNFSDSDVDDDPFKINFEAFNKKTEMDVRKEFSYKSILNPEPAKECQLIDLSQQKCTSEAETQKSRQRFTQKCSGNMSLQETPSSNDLNAPLILSPIEGLPVPQKLRISRELRIKRKEMKLLEQQDVEVKLKRRNSQGNLSGNLDLSDVIVEEDDDPNPELTVRVKWEIGQYHRIKMRKLQKFSFLYEHLAQLHNLNASQVTLYLREDPVPLSIDSCPADANLTIADTIDGFKNQDVTTIQERHNAPVDTNAIKLRLQSADRRGTVILSIRRDEKLLILMHKYAEEKSVSLDSFKFSFDGEILTGNETPETLDLDDGECIDVFNSL